MEHNKKNWHLIRTLGLTLIASYGSLFYAFSLLAPEIHRTLGWRIVAEVVHPLPFKSYRLREVVREPRFWKLACAFATNSFIFSVLAVHLIPLLPKMGHPIATVVLFAAFIGAMQVAGRIGEMVFDKRAAPEIVGKLTFAMLPAALAVLLLLGIEQWVVGAFCGLYGLSNGILTIVRGIVPQELFGRENYGAIVGALAGPTLMAQAAGPLVIAALVEAEVSSKAVFTILLTISLASAGFYFAAVRRQSPAAIARLGRN